MLPAKNKKPMWFLSFSLYLNKNPKIIIAKIAFKKYDRTILFSKRGSSKKFKTIRCIAKATLTTATSLIVKDRNLFINT